MDIPALWLNDFDWHLDRGLWLSGLWPIRIVVDEAGVSGGWTQVGV